MDVHLEIMDDCWRDPFAQSALLSLVKVHPAVKQQQVFLGSNICKSSELLRSPSFIILRAEF